MLITYYYYYMFITYYYYIMFITHCYYYYYIMFILAVLQSIEAGNTLTRTPHRLTTAVACTTGA
jgi:hypothetical protein